MRRPGDNSPDPPGGRALERLREFQRQHDPVDSSEQDGENAEEVQEQDPNPDKQTDSRKKGQS
jgi:hypothetical protein